MSGLFSPLPSLLLIEGETGFEREPELINRGLSLKYKGEYGHNPGRYRNGRHGVHKNYDCYSFSAMEKQARMFFGDQFKKGGIGGAGSKTI